MEKKKEKIEYDIFEPGTIFEIGEYQVAYGKNPSYQIGDSIYNSQVPYWLNGAQVKYENINLRCSTVWKEVGKDIDYLSFFMPEGKTYLSDIFVTIPYGLIKKNRTGIGATTLELGSPRNSIVVVPTKALAYEKAKNSKIEGTSKYQILYIGSDIDDFNVPDVFGYLEDVDIKYKKFIVVADSLPRLLSTIREEHYKDYFLMIDEIDTYQYDTSYRPALENVIDYYFQFPRTQRCLVSATINSFSNPLIAKEPVIDVCFNSPESRTISLLHTNNVVITAKEHIKNLRMEHPDDYILVAFNSIKKGILPIIRSLDSDTQEDCAILCSKNSKPYVEKYYSEILDQQLPKKITFMTCSFFVGIDINHRFHLISIANSQVSHSLLSIDKFQQIAGRCRHEEGLISETIIYSTHRTNDASIPSIEDVKQEVLNDADVLVNYLKYREMVKGAFSEVVLPDVDDKFIETCRRSYYGARKFVLVRKNYQDEIVPSYFNIDGLLITLNLLKTLYQGVDTLKQQLENQGHSVQNQHIEEEGSLTEIMEEINAERQVTQEEELSNIIQKLRDVETVWLKKARARILKTEGITSCGSVFIDRFLELIDYVPFEHLMGKLSVLGEYDINKYNKFYNSVIFWALDEAHPLKVSFKEAFPLLTFLTGRQITEKFNSIWINMLGNKILTNNQAIPKFKIFCSCKRSSVRDSNGRTEPAYRILSYNVNGFSDEPQERIPIDTNVRELFKAFS